MAEELRLDATVVDRFSKPLGELRAKMQAVARTGAAGTQSTSAQFNEFHKNVSRVTASLRGGLEPSLAAVGLQGLGAGLALGGVAGAIAGVVASIRNFSNSTIELKNLSRETGVAADQIRQLQSVSKQFGVESDAISGGLTAFAGKIYDVKRGVSELIPELGRLEGGAQLIDTLRTKSSGKALDAALGFLSKQPAGERRNRISEALFGTRDFSRLVGDGKGKLDQAIAEAAKRLPQQTKEAEKAAADYEAQIAKLRERFDDLSHSIGSVSIPWISELVTGLDGAIEKGRVFVDLWSKMTGGDTGATKDLKTKLSEWNDTLGNLADSGRDSVVSGFKKLFGIGPAGAAEMRPGGASPITTASLRLKEELKEGAKSGIIEGLRQALGIGDAALTSLGGSSPGYAFGGPGGGRGGGRGGGGGGSSASGGTAPGHGAATPAIEALRKKFGFRGKNASKNETGGGNQPDEFYKSIIRAEGTDKRGDPYNEILGYGAYGSPPKPLTEMTLDEVYEWGQKVLRPNSRLNSSAAGAFQIVGKTQREFQDEAGLSGSDKFSPQNQRRLADVIMKRQGLGAWEGFKIHPGAASRAAAAFNSGLQAAVGAANPGEPKPGTGYKALSDYKDFNSEKVVPGQTDPHKPGFDASAVKVHDYFPGRGQFNPGAESKPGAGLRAQAAASPFGLNGPVSGARTGQATLEVSLKGFPAANTKANGGSLFDKIDVKRGRGMQDARD